jgi:hypothetical protein
MNKKCLTLNNKVFGQIFAQVMKKFHGKKFYFVITLAPFSIASFRGTLHLLCSYLDQGILKGGSFTVPLTSCLTGLD